MTSSLLPADAGLPPVPGAPPLSVAITAYLARFKGPSRNHTGSDLRIFLGWCADRRIEPLAAHRHDLELYVRWLQETAGTSP